LRLATQQLQTSEKLLQRVIVSPIEQEEGQRGLLGAIVSDIASMLSPMAAHHGVKHVLTISPEANRCEVDHTDLLKSALFNLVLNGI
jgi:signal transduction histidine kinase